MWNEARPTQYMRGPMKPSPPWVLPAGTPTSGLPTSRAVEEHRRGWLSPLSQSLAHAEAQALQDRQAFLLSLEGQETESQEDTAQVSSPVASSVGWESCFQILLSLVSCPGWVPEPRPLTSVVPERLGPC